MGRKSKLTDEQWAEIEKKLLEGQPARALAREYAITEAAIRQRKSSQVQQIKDVANQIVTAEKSFRELSIGAQISTQRYAAKMLALSDDMLEGAVHAASTFKRLSAMASTELMKVDETAPEKTAGYLLNVGMLTEAANNSAKTPLGLINANKEAMKGFANQPAEQLPSFDPSKLSTGALEELMHASAAQSQ